MEPIITVCATTIQSLLDEQGCLSKLLLPATTSQIASVGTPIITVRELLPFGGLSASDTHPRR